MGKISYVYLNVQKFFIIRLNWSCHIRSPKNRTSSYYYYNCLSYQILIRIQNHLWLLRFFKLLNFHFWPKFVIEKCHLWSKNRSYRATVSAVIRKIVISSIQFSLTYNASRNLFSSRFREWIIISESWKEIYGFGTKTCDNELKNYLQIVFGISIRTDPTVNTEIFNIFAIMICTTFYHWLRPDDKLLQINHWIFSWESYDMIHITYL